MPGRRKRFYWDSCLFLTWLKNEPRGPGETEGIEEVACLVHAGKADLFTSVIAESEVLESKMTPDQKERFQNLFKRRNVVRVDIDVRIASLAGQIRSYYSQRGMKVSTPDSLHLATAIHYGADELHTTDTDLLRFNGDAAGHKLTICIPRSGQLGLFGGLQPPKIK